ncbi:MAG: TAXI family TRAP transporter solute-binding subunit, partial [Alicyclobacillus sp.]|nr:TAXI family TRAP transporter solute-binding subunit [Alicyclobacillus sp.]
PFDQPVALRQVLYGMPSGFYLIARASSGIQTPADLKGKRLIGKRPALQSLDEFTQTLLSVYGLSPSDVTLLSTAETNEAIQAMEQGTVDAVVLPGSANAPPQQQLAENTPVRFIQIPDDKMQQIITRMTQGAMVIPVPDGRYKGQPHDYKLVGYPTVLAVRADLPDDTVYTLTKTLMEHAGDLAAISVTAKAWTLQNTLSNPHFAVPFHPGAIRYFKEKGVWTDALQAQQDQLLQKRT